MQPITQENERAISAHFITETQAIKHYVSKERQRFNDLDQETPDRKSRIQFIVQNREEIFQKLDALFHSIWQIVRDFEKKTYNIHAEYFRKELGDLLLKAEINKHIFEKPLGYSGDFIVMNYIYDYHDDYLGESSFEMLINYYTCNIPISSSNIKRKNYFKQQIEKALQAYDSPKIASFGAGSARELMELLDEGKIRKPLSFYCVDFEPKALSCIQEELSRRESSKIINMTFLGLDIRDIVKFQKVKDAMSNIDYLYASGLFDYLSERFAKRLAHYMVDLLGKSGEMTIVNASADNSEMRSYYELLGDWHFHHRTKEQLLEWVKDLDRNSYKEIYFDEVSPPNNYLFLKVIK